MAKDYKNKIVKWGRAIPRGTMPAPRRDQPIENAQFTPVNGPKQVTMASMIYALGAGVLFVFALYNLSQGSWFNGIVIFIPAGSLAVLSYKYLQ